MPLNKKGKKIMKAMKEQYGKKKGKSVFYAMENSGKLKKVKKLRGGGGYQGGRSDTPAGAAPAGDVDRSAVGAGSQYSRNKAKAALDAQRKKTVKQLTPFSQSLGGKFLRAGLYLAGVPYAGTMIKKLDKPYYQRGKKTKRKDGPIQTALPIKGPIQTTPLLPKGDGPVQTILPVEGPIRTKPLLPLEKKRLGTVSSTGEFGYSVGFKKGGMLRQGKPKLAKKGWK